MQPTATEPTLIALFTPPPTFSTPLFYYSSGLCISFKVLKEWQTADGMEEGGIVHVCLGVCVCVCWQEIGKAAPQYQMTGRAPLWLSQT